LSRADTATGAARYVRSTARPQRAVPCRVSKGTPVVHFSRTSQSGSDTSDAIPPESALVLRSGLRGSREVDDWRTFRYATLRSFSEAPGETPRRRRSSEIECLPENALEPGSWSARFTCSATPDRSTCSLDRSGVAEQVKRADQEPGSSAFSGRHSISEAPQASPAGSGRISEALYELFRSAGCNWERL
jgi:hypothetical protein